MYNHSNTVELPVIKIPPVDVTTAYNGAVSLNCIAYGYGTLYVIWEKREVGIIQNSTAQVYYITDATATDVGSYRCRVISYQYETSVTSDFVTVTGQKMAQYDCIHTYCNM